MEKFIRELSTWFYYFRQSNNFDLSFNGENLPYTDFEIAERVYNLCGEDEIKLIRAELNSGEMKNIIDILFHSAPDINIVVE